MLYKKQEKWKYYLLYLQLYCHIYSYIVQRHHEQK